MRRLFQKRWVWFLLGMGCLPTLWFIVGLFTGPDPKSAMPFGSVFEESRTEFFLPADYSYSLRSKGSMEEFRQFVRKMKMEAHRVSDTRYEQEQGEHVIQIYYEDGWITYHESQS
jgi:hypothetical protein